MLRSEPEDVLGLGQDFRPARLYLQQQVIKNLRACVRLERIIRVYPALN